MAESPKRAQELRGWKEIAAYLRVSVKTAQTLEKEKGLPVRRGGGVKPPVYNTTSELDAWKASLNTVRLPESPLETREDEQGEKQAADWMPKEFEDPVAASQRPESARAWPYPLGRRRWLYGALGAAGLGTAAKFLLGSHQPASAYRVEGATLIIYGLDNAELWRYTFPLQLQESAYKQAQQYCIFHDLNGDGRIETLLFYVPQDLYSAAQAHLVCFSSEGKVLWEFVPGKEVTDNLGRTFAPPYGSYFKVVPSRTGNATVVVTSIHNWSFPNQVALLDGKSGKRLSEYWHRGHLSHITVVDLDGDGEPEVILGGVNDAPEYKQATLVVFDHRRISGSTRNPQGGTYFKGMNPGTEKWTVFFPRTPISEREEFNRVADLRVETGRIKIHVAESITESSAFFVIYELDFALRPINAVLGPQLEIEYRKLQDSGQLPKESIYAICDRLKAQIRVISGDG